MTAINETETGPKFPQVSIGWIDLSGPDGNAMVIMGMATSAMRRAGIDRAEIDAFRAECMSGDYDNLLKTVKNTVDVVLIVASAIDDDDDDDMDWDDGLS